MISVRVRTYEATTPEDQEELMRLTTQELGNPDFPERINVLIGQTKKSLIVMAIEPIDIPWNWPKKDTEKGRKGFDSFTNTEQLFLARRG